MRFCFINKPGWVFALLVLVLSGCATGTTTEQRNLPPVQLSASEEIRLGQVVFPSVIQQLGGVYNDALLADYVAQLGNRLSRFSQRSDLPYHFVVANHSTPNVFVLPGGVIVITRGLLSALDNEGQLAAVLVHQMGHAAARHPLQAVEHGPLLELAVTVIEPVEAQGSYGVRGQQVAQLASGLLNAGYSHQQELEADRLGAECLALAGYDPQDSLQLLEYFYRKVERGVEPPWLTGLFRTHPLSRGRIDQLQRYISDSSWQKAGEIPYGANPQTFPRAVSGLRRTQQGYALFDEARQHEERGQFLKAILLYQQADAAAPDQASILTALGIAFLKADDLAAAHAPLARAVELDDRYYRSRLGLGYLLLEEADYLRAQRELEASMALLPTLQGATLLAGAYEGSQQLGQAREMYRALIQADPGGRFGEAAARRLQELGGL